MHNQCSPNRKDANVAPSPTVALAIHQPVDTIADPKDGKAGALKSST
jgi:hypothetical protein